MSLNKCPHCQIEPTFHYASRVTAHNNANVANRNEWTRYFMFRPVCEHAEAFARGVGVLSQADMDATETRWKAHAETLFAAYTARWSDIERTAFRAKLWPQPPPVIPAELNLQ